MTARVSVLLAGGHAPTRTGIRLALEASGFEVCAEPLDADAAIVEAETKSPGACLIDERLPGGALVAVHTIFRRMPNTKLLILTDTEEPENLFAAIRAGASGYLRKDLDPTRLPTTIRGVLNGEAALSRRMTFQLIEALRTRERVRAVSTKPGGPAMTDRELEVLEMLTEGLGTKAMATRLSIAEVTVRRHLSAAVAKLGVVDRAAAIDVLGGRSSSA